MSLEEEIGDLCGRIKAKESLPSIVQFLDTHPNLDLDAKGPSGFYFDGKYSFLFF